MKYAAFAAVGLVTAGSAAMHPLAASSSIALAALLRLTFRTRSVAVVLVLVLATQDAGLRVDAAPDWTRPHVRRR